MVIMSVTNEDVELITQGPEDVSFSADKPHL
jgi:hypothetical protein